MMAVMKQHALIYFSVPDVTNIIMVSIAGEFTVRDVRGRPSGDNMDRFNVQDLMLITRHCTTVLLVLGLTQNPSKQTYLKTFDVDSWNCISMCGVDLGAHTLYQLLDDIFMYGDRQLWRVTSVIPLAVTYHGHTEGNYDYITVVDQHTLIGVTDSLNALGQAHLFSSSGQILRDFRVNWHQMTARNGIIVVTDRIYPCCELDAVDRVVCTTASAGGDISHNWTSGPLDTSICGLIICDDSIIILDLYSGRRLQTISVFQTSVSASDHAQVQFGNGIAVHGNRAFVGCNESVAEFQLDGKFRMRL
jgi:hypothetical protein